MILKFPSNFRRHPAMAIRSKSPMLAHLYESVDLGGIVSDLIADPGTTLLRPIFHLAPPTLIPRKRGPLVSVIVATRNNAATIERSLRSLLSQTYESIEIVVVDDASEDHSTKIIAALAARDARISVVENSAQMGTGPSRNVGLRVARGEYVTFHDGDDFSEAKRIAMQVKALEANPGKELCLCNYVRVNSRGKGIRVNEKRVMKCIISMMFRRERVVERVGYFINQSISEDSDFYERVKIAFGQSSEIVLPRTLYRALYRRGSSFFTSVDVTHDDDESVQFTSREQTVRANETIKMRHREMRAGRISFRVE